MYLHGIRDVDKRHDRAFDRPSNSRGSGLKALMLSPRGRVPKGGRGVSKNAGDDGSTVVAAGKIRPMEEFSVASGISRPTVSRYFHDPASVRAATRAQIEEALKRLNYRPNLFAVNFNRKHPKTFGMIVPSLTDPFYAELVERVELRALRHGYWTIVLNSHGERSMETRALQTLTSLRVAGAIVAPLGIRSDGAALRDLGKSLPLLLLDSRLDLRASFVGTDNHQSVSLLVDYLHRTGEPPCYFDMPNVNRNAVDRRRAYVLAMKKWGSEPKIV